MKHFFAHVMSSFRPLCIPIAVSSEVTRELDARVGVRARVRGRSRAMGDDEDPEEPYVYSSKPGGSSMYAAVERVLAARPDWISAKSASSFDLLIAERWAIPHSRLGRDGFGGTPSRVPLTNHTRGSKAITVKGLMVKSLRALCETVPGAADFLPETYLVTPGEASDAA